MENVITTETKRDFLKGHFRYYTMNSWNGSHSFARNVKVQRINAPSNAYEFLDCDEVQEMYQSIIEDFTEDHKGKFTIGFNGRSNGYLVLYNSEYQKEEHKSLCCACGQRNFQDVPKGEKAICGKCGKQERISFNFHPRLATFPGRSFGDDIDELEESDVDWMYDIVVKFDEACQNCVDAFIEFCNTHELVDEEITITKTVKVVREKAS